MKLLHLKLHHSLPLVFFLVAGAHAASLPPPVLKALRQAHIPLGSVGVVVREVNARTPLINVNGQQAMNPASTMKLLTTYAGLEMLGPAHTWKTEAWLDGKLEQGVLHGDLILKGYGNPKLTLEQFWLWLRELRGRGLREIRGNLVLDRSAFEIPPHDSAAFDNEPIRPYNVGPDALLLNFNAVRLRFIPDGEKINVISDPGLDSIKLDNRVTAALTGNCSKWDDDISAQLNGDTLLVQGSFPTRCGEREQHVCLLPHPQYLYAVFRALWQEMGGALDGELREGAVPGSATLFATQLSQPLAELIRDTNKFSNNVMARQIFLSLSNSAEESAPASDSLTECDHPACAPDIELPQRSALPAASTARSEQAIRGWLAKKGLRFSELVLENGAGLSRRERISPNNLALLLQSAQRSSLAAEFEASLPIVGVDGTLKKRLNGSAAASHAHLKTGSLEGVQAVAGYVQSRSGKQWVMVFFINHPNASAGQQAQDALIEWLQQKR